MGIGRSTAQNLIETCQRFRIGGSVLTLGRQDIHLTVPELFDMMLRYGLARRVQSNGQNTILAAPTTMEALQRLIREDRHLSVLPAFRQRGQISDKMLFAGLGFSLCDSLDGNAFDHPDHVYDLNQPELAKHIGRQYDFVLDSGTIEHVFDVRMVLKNMFDCTKVGGHVMFVTPSNNYVDHGFYQMSPTLFMDYYSVNKFNILDVKFVRHTKNTEVEPWYYMTYTPGSLDAMVQGLDDAAYAVSFCAQKTDESTWDKIPVQGAYRNSWT